MHLWLNKQEPTVDLGWEPDPYQVITRDKILNEFKTQNKTAIILACGLGKTLVGLDVYEKLNPKISIIFVPSIALVRQFRNSWLSKTKLKNIETLSVCSIKDKDSGKDTNKLKEKDINFQITTDVTKINNDGKVIFGSTVYLENLDTGEKISYKIVGKDEADLKKKLIYFQSPIGKGLISKNKNDLVEIITPAGIKKFEIKDVKYI